MLFSASQAMPPVNAPSPINRDDVARVELAHALPRPWRTVGVGQRCAGVILGPVVLALERLG